MRLYYALDADNRVIEMDDLLTWARWFEKANRIVARTQINSEVSVSTVFLGIDHNPLLTGPPLLFETMVFGGELDGDMNRYSTWEEAETGHNAFVRWVRARSKGVSRAEKG